MGLALGIDQARVGVGPRAGDGSLKSRLTRPSIASVTVMKGGSECARGL